MNGLASTRLGAKSEPVTDHDTQRSRSLRRIHGGEKESLRCCWPIRSRLESIVSFGRGAASTKACSSYKEVGDDAVEGEIQTVPLLKLNLLCNQRRIPSQKPCASFFTLNNQTSIRQGDIDVLREVTLADLIQLFQRSGGCSALSRPCRSQRVENNRCDVSLGEFRVSSSSSTLWGAESAVQQVFLFSPTPIVLGIFVFVFRFLTFSLWGPRSRERLGAGTLPFNAPPQEG